MVAVSKENEDLITQEYLKSLYFYNPITGDFTYLKRVANCVKIGDIAGTLRKNGYITIRIKNIGYQAHRLAWLYMRGKWPENKIDHDDHNRSNNKFKNLKAATDTENSKNKSIMKNNKSGCCGVHWCKRERKWIATIRVNLKLIALLCSIDKFEAICARKSADNKYDFHENHGK